MLLTANILIGVPGVVVCITSVVPNVCTEFDKSFHVVNRSTLAPLLFKWSIPVAPVSEIFWVIKSYQFI